MWLDLCTKTQVLGVAIFCTGEKQREAVLRRDYRARAELCPMVLCRSLATLYPWFSSFVYTDRVYSSVA